MLRYAGAAPTSATRLEAIHTVYIILYLLQTSRLVSRWWKGKRRASSISARARSRIAGAELVYRTLGAWQAHLLTVPRRLPPFFRV